MNEPTVQDFSKDDITSLAVLRITIDMKRNVNVIRQIALKSLHKIKIIQEELEVPWAVGADIIQKGSVWCRFLFQPSRTHFSLLKPG